MTDQQIFTAAPESLSNETLLHLAARYTSVHIAEQANAAKGSQVISGAVVRKRLFNSIDRIAKRDGRDREDVKAELDATRSANGIADGRSCPNAQEESEPEDQPKTGPNKVSIHFQGALIKVVDFLQQSTDVEEGDEANAVDTLLDAMDVDEAESMDIDDPLREWAVHGLFEDESAMMDDDIVQLTSLYTITEIVGHLNNPKHTAKSVRQRVDVAIYGLATRKGRNAKEYATEFVTLKAANGVAAREKAQQRKRRRTDAK